MFWWNYCQNLLWLRNHVVAPLSEEFTFRACMLPLLLQTFSPMTAIFITPLFFGVGKLEEEALRGDNQPFDFCLFHNHEQNSLTNSKSMHRSNKVALYFSTPSSYDRATSHGNGQEDSNSHLVLPILLHVGIRDLLSLSVCSNRALCGAVPRPRFLQPHGIPRLCRSYCTTGA